MPLYSLKHKVQINSKALIITQQHKYSSKKGLPSGLSSDFLRASQYICNFLSATVHFSRVCRCCLFLQLNDIQCMHKKCNELFHLEDQNLSYRQFSRSLAFGDWHIKMMVPKHICSKAMHPPGRLRSVSLYLAVSHTGTHRDVYDSRKTYAVEGLQLH